MIQHYNKEAATLGETELTIHLLTLEKNPQGGVGGGGVGVE